MRLVADSDSLTSVRPQVFILFRLGSFDLYPFDFVSTTWFYDFVLTALLLDNCNCRSWLRLNSGVDDVTAQGSRVTNITSREVMRRLTTLDENDGSYLMGSSYFSDNDHKTSKEWSGR